MFNELYITYAITIIIIFFFHLLSRVQSSLRSTRVVHRPKYMIPFSMDCRERGSHARGVYLTQDTSLMGTARVKQEEEADTRIIEREW